MALLAADDSAVCEAITLLFCFNDLPDKRHSGKIAYPLAEALRRALSRASVIGMSSKASRAMHSFSRRMASARRHHEGDLLPSRRGSQLVLYRRRPTRRFRQ